MSLPTEFPSTVSSPSSPSALTTAIPPSSKSPSTGRHTWSCPAQVSSPASIRTILPSFKSPPIDSQPSPVQTKEQLFVDNVSPSDKDRATRKRHFEFSLPSDQGSRPKKHDFECSLPSDQDPRPSKRLKKLLTTVSATREKDIEDFHALRMLQLARASREVFSANTKYRLTRIHELDVMRAIAHDEYEEAAALLKNADCQIEELERFLAANGTGITTLSSLNLPPVPASYSDAESSVDGASPRSVSPFDV
ncbi:hypothetical protein J3R83DRAFT_1636 [Lanmaoa asiatica]|nr:hypothetical protein J3R83DRAFT_1636 [Lanmaoa asiatica]